MHVALAAHLLNTTQSYRSAGVSTYSRRLIEQLGRQIRQGTEFQLTALISDPIFQTEGVHIARGPALLQQPLLRIAWEQAVIPFQLRQLKADLVHGLVNVLPLTTTTPGIVTVHDLSFLRMPEKLSPTKRFYLARLCQASVHRARHVITVSQQTADDVMAFFATPATKITVVPNGVDAHFQPGDAAETVTFRQAHALPERFILYLGTLEPRKNLLTLLRAYAQWQSRAAREEQAIKLVLAGGKGWDYEQIFTETAALGLTEQVIFPGFIPEADLPQWYRAAEFFVYPSFLEGFGLPVLEAMACGTPVICSDAGSLVEVAGDAAWTFPATDVDTLAQSLHSLSTQAELRAELRTRGLQRAQQFSWQRTAAATLDIYHQMG